MLAFAFQLIIDLLAGAVRIVVLLLPRSPFRDLSFGLYEMQLLRWLAWVLPLDFIFTMLVAWLYAMAHFYSFSIILRKLNVIK